MINWISGRLSEPSSYAAVGAGLVGVGVIISITEVVMLGVACVILGVIIKEKSE
jgi:sulfite exporter TauE/SafE